MTAAGIRAKVRDGPINVLGFTVCSPDLLRLSTKGELLHNEKITPVMRKAFGEMRLIPFGYDLQDRLVFVGPTDQLIEETLDNFRNYQVDQQVKKAKRIPHIRADQWREMVAFQLHLLEQDSDISRWWCSCASLYGDQAPWAYQARLNRAAWVRPTAKYTPCQAEISDLTDRLAWYLKPRFFMGPEPERFTLSNGVTFYAKSGDNERRTGRQWRHFVGNTTNLSYKEKVRLLDLQERFAGCFAVLSVDGANVHGAVVEDVNKELVKKEIDLEFPNMIPDLAAVRKAWRRVVREKFHRMGLCPAAKRKAPTATVERKKCRNV